MLMYSKKLKTCKAWTSPQRYYMDELSKIFKAIWKLKTDMKVYCKEEPPLLAAAA